MMAMDGQTRRAASWLEPPRFGPADGPHPRRLPDRCRRCIAARPSPPGPWRGRAWSSRTSGRRTGCWPACAGPGPIATRSGRALLEADPPCTGALRGSAAAGRRPLRRRDHGAAADRAGAVAGSEVRGGFADRRDRHARHSAPSSRAGEGIGRRIHEVASSIADDARARAPSSRRRSATCPWPRASSAATRPGTGRERVAHLLYRSVIGRAAVPGPRATASCRWRRPLSTARRQLVLDGAIHGPGAGGALVRLRRRGRRVVAGCASGLARGLLSSEVRAVGRSRAATAGRGRSRAPRPTAHCALSLTGPRCIATVPGAGWSSGSSSGS